MNAVICSSACWATGEEIAQQTFALALEDGHVDLATSLAILSHELIEVRRGCPAS